MDCMFGPHANGCVGSIWHGIWLSKIQMTFVLGSSDSATTTINGQISTHVRLMALKFKSNTTIQTDGWWMLNISYSIWMSIDHTYTYIIRTMDPVWELKKKKTLIFVSIWELWITCISPISHVVHVKLHEITIQLLILCMAIFCGKDGLNWPFLCAHCPTRNFTRHDFILNLLSCLKWVSIPKRRVYHLGCLYSSCVPFMPYAAHTHSRTRNNIAYIYFLIPYSLFLLNCRSSTSIIRVRKSPMAIVAVGRSWTLGVGEKVYFWERQTEK